MITEDKKHDIAEKVQALLRLSESSNPFEAGLAAEKAREILEKYNITLNDVEISTAEMIEEEIKVAHRGRETVSYTKLPSWVRRLLTPMRTYFYIRPLLAGNGKILFLGAKQDVDVAVYVFSYLVREIERITDAYMKECSGSSLAYQKSQRASYTNGAVTGVAEVLKSEARSKDAAVSASGTELVVLKESAVAKFVKEMHPRLSKVKSNSNLSFQSGAFSQGVNDGKNISIRRGVKSSNGEVQRSISN